MRRVVPDTRNKAFVTKLEQGIRRRSSNYGNNSCINSRIQQAYQKSTWDECLSLFQNRKIYIMSVRAIKLDDTLCKKESVVDVLATVSCIIY